MADRIIQGKPFQMDMTPYYMATISSDIFQAATAVETDSKRPWFKYFLYCVVIEMGLKASLLNNNNTPEQKSKNKKIGHNLTALRKAADGRLPDGLLTDKAKETIDQISPFFASKSLEYVSGELLRQMATGGKQLPDITDLGVVARKVVDYVESQKHFIHSDTST